MDGSRAARHGRGRTVERHGRADRAGDLPLQLHDRRRADDRSGQSRSEDRLDVQHARERARGPRRSPGVLRWRSRCRMARSARIGTTRSRCGTLRRAHGLHAAGVRSATPTDAYPVLYLFHGANADETAWHRLGRANLILDNLLAAGKITPFLVVMPFGYGVDPGAGCSPAENTELFGKDLLEDVIPYVEATLPRVDATATIARSSGCRWAAARRSASGSTISSSSAMSADSALVSARTEDFPKAYASADRRSPTRPTRSCGCCGSAAAGRRRLRRVEELLGVPDRATRSRTPFARRRAPTRGWCGGATCNEIAPLLFRNQRPDPCESDLGHRRAASSRSRLGASASSRSRRRRSRTGFEQPCGRSSTTYCAACHGGAAPAAQFDLRTYTDVASVVGRSAAVGAGARAARRRARCRRPRRSSRLPKRAERVMAWLEAMRTSEARKHAGDPGVVLARRLSNAEYNYTIRDLTGVDIRPAREFPVDPANPAGFDNSGESLAMSPALLTKYLQAAQEVGEYVNAHVLLRVRRRAAHAGRGLRSASSHRPGRTPQDAIHGLYASLAGDQRRRWVGQPLSPPDRSGGRRGPTSMDRRLMPWPAPWASRAHRSKSG